MRGVLAIQTAQADVSARAEVGKYSFRNLNKKLASCAMMGTFAILTGCGAGSGGTSLSDLNNAKVKPAVDADRAFDTPDGEMRVISRDGFEKLVAAGQVKRLQANAGADPSELIIALPKAILGQEHLFGAVITKTDNKDNETYGGLKLTDLPPIHVFPAELTQNGQKFLVLQGCVQNCKPHFTDRENVGVFPLSGEDADKLYIDFTKIGSDMNLVEIMDPQGEFTHLKAVSAKTVEVSYTANTLEFDVDGLMQEVAAPPAIQNLFGVPNLVQARDTGKEVSFTTKWYLRKRELNAKYKPQVATDGVGFFLTERYSAVHIMKQPNIDSAGNANTVHYFIKNVPQEFQAPFKQAFDDWNAVFQQEIGAPLLTYEFVNQGDSLGDALTPGDVRVHVVEWDLNAVAGYGGLGPSIGDQETGSIVSSNILIQGPTIIQIYTKWFQASREAQALEEAGLNDRADEVLRAARNEAFQEINFDRNGPRFALALGGKLKFNVNAQDPRLQDGAVSKIDFEIVPKGVSFDDYMFGYFREMVGHELGHNMGLRHNFRGNLFASSGLEVGKQSASIMEYLGRPYRYKDQISAYDHMAIQYGYTFKAPGRRDMYCTDEDVGDVDKHAGSAECSKDDAENNPYAMLTNRLTRVRDLYVGTGTQGAPNWDKTDMAATFATYSNGILLYGESADRSLSTWLRFFEGAGRPAKNANAVKQYVAATLAQVACQADLESSLVNAKGAGSEAARISLENLKDFRQQVRARVQATLGDSFAAQVNCATANPAADEEAGPGEVAGQF